MNTAQIKAIHWTFFPVLLVAIQKAYEESDLRNRVHIRINQPIMFINQKEME